MFAKVCIELPQTSRYEIPPTMMKLLAVAASLIVTLAVAIVGWMYYSLTALDTSSCIRFEISGTAEARGNAFAAFPSQMKAAGLALKGENAYQKIWQSDGIGVSLISDINPEDYSVTVCAEESKHRQWQDVTKHVEGLAQGSKVQALLQMNIHSHRCDPNCDLPLATPVNFDRVREVMRESRK